MYIFDELKKLKEEVITHPEKLTDLISLMKSPECREEIEKTLDFDEIPHEDIQNVKTLVDCAQTIYNYSGEETGMSDSEYDKIYEMLSQVDDDIGITVPIVSSGKIGYHKYPSLRGTLDKVYALTDEDNLENKSRRTLDEWIKSSETKIFQKTGERINLSNEEIYCFPKFDGVSAIFEYSKDGTLQRVLTRGFTETNEAQDITHHFYWVGKGPEMDYDYGIKTEIMMSDEDFEKYNSVYHTDYKQSRSIVSSILNSDETDDRIKYLQIMQLRYSKLVPDEKYGTVETLQELAPGAFNTPYLRCRLCDRDQMRKFAFDHKYTNGLRCDGMVIYIINPKIQKILGRADNKQKFEVAFKFTEEFGYSKIKDIKFTAGLFGRINPVAEIKPIKLKGNTIENVSLGSMGRFKSLGLAKGDKVKVLYDIIPYIVFDKDDPKCKKSGENPIPVPWCCPECMEPLESSDSGDIMFCNNPKCPCKQKGRILNYFNKMHIDGISYATVDTLYREGYLESIKDIYKLEKHRKKLIKLSGFGDKSIDNILDEINNNRTVPSSQMLGSLGIEGVSTKTFDKVFSMISYDELIELATDDKPEKAVAVLTVIPGIKDKTARKIIEGIQENIKTIEFLEKELELVEPVKKESKFSVVFTKVRDKELEEWTVEQGGTVKDALSKDVSVLVVPAIGVESTKVDKAKKYNIPIVDIKNYKEFIKDLLMPF